jgi:hypothetical protein
MSAHLPGAGAADLSGAQQTLTMLELKGLTARLPGDRYSRIANGSAPQIEHSNRPENLGAEVRAVVKSIIRCVRWYLHGISRKYLQHCLAAYWCYKDRTQWSCTSILSVCLKSRPVTYNELLEYVSPRIVKVLSEQ